MQHVLVLSETFLLGELKALLMVGWAQIRPFWKYEERGWHVQLDQVLADLPDATDVFRLVPRQEHEEKHLV